MERKNRRRTAAALVAGMLLLGACSGAGSAALTTVAGGGADDEGGAPAVDQATAATATTAEAAGGDAEAPAPARYQLEAALTLDQRIIRDGRIDLRIDPGDFATRAAQLRSIAEDLGGYIAGAESHIEEVDQERYSVGWFTLRVPEDRFEDAMAKVEGLGERLDFTLSSQDVSEEYVDLQSRLRYWRNQEAFYSRLLDEATTVQDLVAVNSQMEQVLTNIEQIEGRLRYLESRTSFSTLTVGLTEVPAEAPVAAPAEPSDPTMLEEAVDMAGQVLLGTIGFLIVAAAFLLPLGAVALVAYLIYRLVVAVMRRETRVTESG